MPETPDHLDLPSGTRFKLEKLDRETRQPTGKTINGYILPDRDHREIRRGVNFTLVPTVGSRFFYGETGTLDALATTVIKGIEREIGRVIIETQGSIYALNVLS